MLLSQLFSLYTPSFLRVHGHVGTQRQSKAHCFAWRGTLERASDVLRSRRICTCASRVPQIIEYFLQTNGNGSSVRNFLLGFALSVARRDLHKGPFTKQ